MGNTLLCALGLFLFSTVFYGNAEAYKPRASLKVDSSIIPAGDSVTLTCSVDSSSGWKIYWFRFTSLFSTSEQIKDGELLSISEGGLYHCRGGRGDPVVYTEDSNVVEIEKRVLSKAVITRQPDWSQIFRGETMTLRCEIQDGGNTEWEYEWRINSRPIQEHGERLVISDSSYSYGGSYSCRGKPKGNQYSSTEWSDAMTVTVTSYKPRASLKVDSSIIPAGGSVTLTCSVNSSSGWKFYWFRFTSLFSTSEQIKDGELLSISEGGLYHCRGGRGDPVVYTRDSNVVKIERRVLSKAVITRQPDWSQIFRGETMTLRCEIQDGGNTEWKYEWRINSGPIQEHDEHLVISDSSYSYGGSYSCRGKLKRNKYSSTKWSDPMTVTVTYTPRPLLTVSPSWLSPGASVTLSCEVEHPSAGWRFYWYKTVPDLSGNSYSYELLPGSTNGTEQDSYIVHGQTQTAGYSCRAGRGQPVYYSDYSEPRFVWTGDIYSLASLTVNPDTVQHFTSKSVSLTCQGNSTKWRVMKFTERGHRSYLSGYKTTMSASKYNIDTSRSSNAVYWCESGSGEFSNAVNITITDADIVLVSPVHPVTEGAPVSLSCIVRRQKILSSVFFYHNDKLVKNDTRAELNISAVSKSDEGFYKCLYSGKESPQSWMSVKTVSRPESSSFAVSLIVGLVCGIILIILLLMLYCCRKSKESCFIKSENTNRDSTTNHGANQDETNEYSSPLNGTTYLYESIRHSGDTENGAQESQDVTYSSIELENFRRKQRHEPEEGTVYSEVKMGTADTSPVYAQVNRNNEVKAKRGNSCSSLF